MPITYRTNRVQPKRRVRKDKTTALKSTKNNVTIPIKGETLQAMQIQFNKLEAFDPRTNKKYCDELNKGLHLLVKSVDRYASEDLLDTMQLMSEIIYELHRYYGLKSHEQLANELSKRHEESLNGAGVKTAKRKHSALPDKIYSACGFYTTPVSRMFKSKHSQQLLNSAETAIEKSLKLLQQSQRAFAQTPESIIFMLEITTQLKTIQHELKRAKKLKKAINDAEKLVRINLALQIAAAACCLGLIVTACVTSMGIAPAVAAGAVAAAIIGHAIWARHNKNKGVINVISEVFDVGSTTLRGEVIAIANRVDNAVEVSVEAIHRAYNRIAAVTIANI